MPFGGKTLPGGADSCCLAAGLRGGLPPAAFNAPAKSWVLVLSVESADGGPPETDFKLDSATVQIGLTADVLTLNVGP